MKTILWATLSANGNYAQSGPDNPPKKEALHDFATHAKAAGNFIVGRRTFEGMRGNGGPGPVGEVDIVIVSRNASDIPGVTVVRSPEEALNHLRQKGHHTALISGGADIHNSFLSQNLVDEVIFNVAPVMEGKGLNILIDKDNYLYKHVELLNCKPLGGGIVQLRYAIHR
ncbi:riboflavin biosynthesis protein RibD [Paenibacillus glycanilyticus]|uniref:Riboflavin biosynthesis protein RibD n=1 Tax=Paenibacillus glycanilyticus TaxID=126569 RepID=A0ABQ6NVJ7_9BACL|nr:dihydrofolate reductase [Paenibacillus glycanilyticus]GMK49076.1 riboflavin biosynthesis protein RibD [Paenibacillus glycanilyticus]